MKTLTSLKVLALAGHNFASVLSMLGVTQETHCCRRSENL